MSAPVHSVVALTLAPVRIPAHWACAASVGADCRSECLDTTCQTWPCSHDWVDSGQCNAVKWFDSYEPRDTYAGTGTGNFRCEFISGPINVWWDGDGWAWGYPQAAPISGPAQPPRVSPEGYAAGLSATPSVTRAETDPS